MHSYMADPQEFREAGAQKLSSLPAEKIHAIASVAAAAAAAAAAALAASAAKLACLCLSYSLARSPLRLPGSADIEVSNVSSDILEKHNFSIDSVADGC